MLIISLDTTRADYVDAQTTPHLWDLAARGTRFEWALAHAPTTVSSHASVWTGLDAHGHRVPHNGVPLDESFDTFPVRFAAAGYDTLGVIGASVIDASQGLSRGFRVWDAKFEIERARRHETRAANVTDRALALASTRLAGKPLLLFVHYYDAHGPFAAPEPFTRTWAAADYDGPFDGSTASTKKLARAVRDGTADPADLRELRARYRGEISYVDAQVGRLLQQGVLNDPIVVVFGDHGEILGEDPEHPVGHGAEVDLIAIHVPLVVSGPSVPAGTVSSLVGLQDIGPTVLALAGLSPDLGNGRDLAPLWRGETLDRVVFSEATQPEEHLRKGAWPNLDLARSVARGKRLLIRTPWKREAPELYAIAPGQPRVDDPATRAALTELLAAWDARAPGWRDTSVSAHMEEALEALGYRD